MTMFHPNQCSHFMTLYFGSKGMDILEPQYKGHFAYNSFVKFHGKTIQEPQHDHVMSKSVL